MMRKFEKLAYRRFCIVLHMVILDNSINNSKTNYLILQVQLFHFFSNKDLLSLPHFFSTPINIDIYKGKLTCAFSCL